MIISGLILCGGLIIYSVIKRIIHNFAEKKLKHNAINFDSQRINTFSSLLSSIFKYLIYFLILYYILFTFGVSNELLLAIAGIGSVALGFGSQTLVKDVISGLFILFEGQYIVGDKVSISGIIGYVESLGLRTTRIKSEDGSIHIIPNGSIATVTSIPAGVSIAVIELVITGENMVEKTIDLINNESSVLSQITGIMSSPKILKVTSGDGNNFSILITCNCTTESNWKTETELRKKLCTLLAANSIDAPYPTLKSLT